MGAQEVGPFPMAIATADADDDALQGELWWVDAATLEQLDRLEGHPRLYERRPLTLASGGALALALLTTVVATALPGGVATPSAFAAPTADCRAWLSSQGEQRIRLGNQLGAAHYLTKNQRLQTSPDEAPVSLYRPSDLRRLCDGR
jgi:hypothetical protein